MGNVAKEGSVDKPYPLLIPIKPFEAGMSGVGTVEVLLTINEEHSIGELKKIDIWQKTLQYGGWWPIENFAVSKSAGKWRICIDTHGHLPQDFNANVYFKMIINDAPETESIASVTIRGKRITGLKKL